MLKIKEDDSLLIQIPEARQLLGLGKSSTKVYNIIRTNVKHINMGRRWDISRESLYEYINKMFEESTLN